jgi:hypothetical protein
MMDVGEVVEQTDLEKLTIVQKERDAQL